MIWWCEICQSAESQGRLTVEVLGEQEVWRVCIPCAKDTLDKNTLGKNTPQSGD